MSEDWNNRIKKLALAYETGWEYMAKSDEAGSVLTDVFLEMEGKNRESCRGMWKKHKLEFLQAVPAEDSEAKRLRTALVVRVTDRDSGKFLKKGTKAYTLLEKEGCVTVTIKRGSARGLPMTAAQRTGRTVIRSGFFSQWAANWSIRYLNGASAGCVSGGKDWPLMWSSMGPIKPLELMDPVEVAELKETIWISCCRVNGP